MRKSNKGLNDLKHLRQQALQAEPGLPDPTSGATNEGAGTRWVPDSSSSPPANPDDPDGLLFKQAMRSVTPLKTHGRTVSAAAAGQPKELLRQRRRWACGPDSTPASMVSDHFLPAGSELDPTRFVRPGQSPGVPRDLKRGKWPVQASLDLHGCTLDQARTRLDQFLLSCLAHHLRCVHIIHGKGFGSKNGAPVLKQSVRRWLTRYDAVLAYTQCSEQFGGAGAVQVLLRPTATPHKGTP